MALTAALASCRTAREFWAALSTTGRSAYRYPLEFNAGQSRARHGQWQDYLPELDADVSGIYAHYQQIAEAVPDLPFFPYLFGGQTDAPALMQELKQRIPNLHGAKYTGPNMYELGRVLDQSAAEWTIFSGMDEQCLFAMMVGAPDNIGSTLNFMPGLYRDMRARFHAAVSPGRSRNA